MQKLKEKGFWILLMDDGRLEKYKIIFQDIDDTGSPKNIRDTLFWETTRMVYALTFSFSWKFYVFAAKEIQGVKGRWTFDTRRILW